MKLRYKKTGEIFTPCSLWFDEDIGSLDRTKWRTLKEFCEDWEDYEPQEPLIRDKKIRKAVRAWANVNCIMQVIYAKRKDNSLSIFTDYDGDDDFSIEFVGWIPTLIDAEVYTIAELCGKDEE